MDIENIINVNHELKNELNLENKQNNFLDSMLGKAINTGMDIGLRTVLPDFVEEQVIDIKDNLLEYGIKNGVKKSINDAINIGKSAIGIVTGNFENVEQMQNAVKSGGLIDSISELIDVALNKMNQKGKINSNISNMIKQGKNSILNSVESNIENSFERQLTGTNKLEKYINNWNRFYNNQDFNGMEKEYKKIRKELKNLAPLENTIKKARAVENMHTLIKTNGQNFNLSETEKELLEKFK